MTVANSTVINALPPFFYTQVFLIDVAGGFVVLTIIELFLLRNSSLTHLRLALPFLTFSIGFTLISLYLSPYITYNPVYTTPYNVTYRITPYSTDGVVLLYISIAVLAMAIAYFVYAFAVDVLHISFGGSSDNDGYFIP
jgi:energy-coupling factor transporter transmembrane protein EcfT